MADLIFGNNPTKKYSKEFKEYLINQLKISAQTIIDNAEEIIGDYMFTGDLRVTICMPTDKKINDFEQIFPRININKVIYSNYDYNMENYEKYANKCSDTAGDNNSNLKEEK